MKTITRIEHIPANGVVEGDLNLYGKEEVTTLPEGLSVGGNLELGGTGITALPEGLSVGGYLYLKGTAITALPEGLSVGGYLDLSGTGITALPEGLTVGGSLYLSDTKIPKIERENVGSCKRTIYAIRYNKDIWFCIGCFFGDYDKALKAVENKYSKDSDYYRTIKEMYNEAQKTL